MIRWSNVLYSMGTFFRSNWNLEMLVFEEWGKPGVPREKAQTTVKWIWKTSAISTAMGDILLKLKR